MGKIVRPVPSRELLVKLLDYDHETGALLWKMRDSITPHDRCFNTKYAGKSAGSLTVGRKDGTNRYVVVGIRTDRYQQYHAHRLIWMMMTGEQPPMIDHRDGDEMNLKWDNLRAATHGQNIQNSKLRKDNKSGVKGVFWDSSRKKWAAVISIHNRQTKLGRFATIEQAAGVINSERIRLHGEFARLN